MSADYTGLSFSNEIEARSAAYCILRYYQKLMNHLKPLVEANEPPEKQEAILTRVNELKLQLEKLQQYVDTLK